MRPVREKASSAVVAVHLYVRPFRESGQLRSYGIATLLGYSERVGGSAAIGLPFCGPIRESGQWHDYRIATLGGQPDIVGGSGYKFDTL